MQTHNSCYFILYRFLHKPALAFVSCFLVACNVPNNTKQFSPTENPIQVSESAVNINTASAEELEKLPRVGTKTAQAIIRHRELFGRFRKPEHLVLVRGISDKQFREMRNFIKVE